MKKLSKVLLQRNCSTYLTELLSKIQNLQRLNSLFGFFVDDKDLAKHCHITKVAKDVLFLTVSSSVWATKLHYAIPGIIKTISAHPEFSGIKKISYSIVHCDYYSGRDKQTKRKRRVISKENQQLWSDTLKLLKSHKK